MTHRLQYNSHLHTSRTFLALAEAVLSDPTGLPALLSPTPPNLPQPAECEASAQELAEVWRLLGCKPGERWPIIVLNPNCGDLLPLRRWPPDRYVELAQRLLMRFRGALVVFTGSWPEAETTLRLARRIGSERCISIAGKTTLRELLVLYTVADVLVTNDSGPAHFATLTPIRVVSLFGPETPESFGAQTARNTALWAKLPCSPCVSAYNNRQSPCRYNQCMQSISADTVFEAVCGALGAAESSAVYPGLLARQSQLLTLARS